MNAYSNAERAAVAFLYDNGVTSGISSTQYGPALPISRGDFAVMIYRAFWGLPHLPPPGGSMTCPPTSTTPRR